MKFDNETESSKPPSKSEKSGISPEGKMEQHLTFGEEENKKILN